MIFYILAGLIGLCSVINFKRGFILFLAFKLLLVQNVTLISIPGVPLLTLDMFMSMVYSFWFFMSKNNRKTAKYSFPYLTPNIVISFSWIISSAFSVASSIPSSLAVPIWLIVLFY